MKLAAAVENGGEHDHLNQISMAKIRQAQDQGALLNAADVIFTPWVLSIVRRTPLWQRSFQVGGAALFVPDKY